ncbi:bifunctional phosphopantothenoylcysteine decarboxylase/phosphopantothenate--cysteine ligase CoaBC [Mycoplasmopsis gallinacea]|uniref:Coenzyme A biosynthesis bifunctional protein CoaBC n=1 Tax=Mycoplasmopsis gallinacea TaxID=29556 RepID=A0A449A348_9BACT|nr:bifunctional phosphopantothenoylcysteine decarboxylase/phosphopantothenate--cysteine ligase CoaBC [Mycoplasmopsis gallinacea]VEU58675.1 DNA/pantothenate metabolism flavoprotein [Mycoplasmopsis gallinacea]
MKILIIASSSVAIKKLESLISNLEELDWEIKILFTNKAGEIFTFSTERYNDYILNQNKDMEDFVHNPSFHVELAKEFNHIIIYPATFNTINKYANGIADSLATTILAMGFHNKTIIAPAMNFNMYQNPILQASIEKLKKLGVTFIGPNYGILQCGDIGIGRVIEPYEVINFLTNKNKPKLLISIGYTNVYLDDVRTVSVKSSGQMGIFLAKELSKYFDLTIINANISQLNNYFDSRTKIINVDSVFEYQEAVFKYIKKNDVFVSVAAVSDFIFEKHEAKIKKSDNVSFNYKIGIDVLKEVSILYPDKIKIGFALESQNLLENGTKKLKTKNLDLIVVNNKNTLKSQFSTGFLIEKDGFNEFTEISKHNLAQLISEKVYRIWKEKQ